VRFSIFQQSFARLFVAYRDAYLANQLGQFIAAKGETEIEYVTDDEFLRQNGPPPWKFVNESLAAAGLDFKINQPTLNENTPFQPELTKLSTGVTLPFAALSSGEKILMSFAFCVYYSNDRRQLALYPKMILLDEVDAPLHPSMSKNLISTIRQTLVASYGIKVILTTHSPSTVAMAPEEAVYVMKPGIPGLHKSSRAEALNILTVGVPTLAISYEGRRQVFVESPSDAKAYDAIYKLLKPKIMSERSLDFVATGTRSASGAERNTGCEVVKKIVSDLTIAGNQSVFGLIDWDGHHESTKRIVVLAEGARNGLENLIFDPLTMALLICRDFPAEKRSLGIPSETNFISFAQLDPVEMQRVVSRVTELVLGGPAVNTVQVKYLGGMILDVDARYLTTDDHALEGLLTAAFPFLQAVSKQQAGRLIQQVIATVLTDVPDSIPVALKETMQEILERPSH
jgi:energy-coupling factor transporter ATP-binding protein EcfA2